MKYLEIGRIQLLIDNQERLFKSYEHKQIT